MIDLCPVGALNLEPFRYKARTWELTRRRSISRTIRSDRTSWCR